MPLLNDLDKKVLLEYLTQIAKSTADFEEATNQIQARNALVDLEFYLSLAKMRIDRINNGA